MAPAVDAHWLSAHDFTLPSWTRADDDFDNYTTESSKRRKFRRKTRPQDALPRIVARDDATTSAPPAEDDLSSDADGIDSLSEETEEEEEEEEEEEDEATSVIKDPLETMTPEAPPTTSGSLPGDQKSVSVSVSSVIVEPGTGGGGGGGIGESTTKTTTIEQLPTATMRLTTLTPAIPLPTTTARRTTATTMLISSRTMETISTSTSTIITTSSSSPTEETTRSSMEPSETSSTSSSISSTSISISISISSSPSPTSASPQSIPPGFSSHIHLTDATALPQYTIQPPSSSTDILKISHHTGIHSEVHKVLIGVGSVVGFILLVGLCFIAWKLSKRNRRRTSPQPKDMSFAKPTRRSALLAQFPFLKKRFAAKVWYTIPDPVQQQQQQQQQQHMSEKKLHLNIPSSTPRQETRFYSPDKPRGVAGLGIVNPPVAKAKPVATTMNPPKSDAGGNASPSSTVIDSDTAVNTGTAVAVTVTRHVPKPSISSIQAQANNTMTTTTAATQPPLYGPHRQTFYSDMSSLSSGFGDGDIIIPPAPAAAPPPHHISWRSSKSSGSAASAASAGRRDTMYTEASEDNPPRFRTVTSWVRQQTGRVKRAQEKDTPPVPDLPPEQEFGMMMPDGEVPRRVDMTMGGTAAY